MIKHIKVIGMLNKNMTMEKLKQEVMLIHFL